MLLFCVGWGKCLHDAIHAGQELWRQMGGVIVAEDIFASLLERSSFMWGQVCKLCITLRIWQQTLFVLLSKQYESKLELFETYMRDYKILNSNNHYGHCKWLAWLILFISKFHLNLTLLLGTQILQHIQKIFCIL